MRKLGVLALLFAGVAVAGSGITLNPGVRFEFTTCASGGSSSQTVKRGTYLFRVLKEDTTICYATTCVSGGEDFAVGTNFKLTFQNDTDVSCRSTGGTGKAVFTRGE